MALSIFLVFGDRGSYSERMVYAVCWYTTRVEADRRAAEMFEASEARRAPVQDAAGYGAALDRAREELGDINWSAYDQTEYKVEEIEHGDVDLALFSNEQLDELYQQLEGESQTFAERALEVQRVLDARLAATEAK